MTARSRRSVLPTPYSLLLLILLLAPRLSAHGLRPDPAARAIEAASAEFRAASFTAAATRLEAWADRDPRARRQLMALRFLDQDLAGVESLATGGLSPRESLWAARAAAGRADWRACLRHLDALGPAEGAWTALLRAEAFQALGDRLAPGAWLTALSATAGTRLAAATAMEAAEAAEALGDAALAEARYKLAEDADPSYSMVHARLARLYLAQGRVKDARIRLERALKVDPADKASRTALNRLLAKSPGQKRALDREARQKAERFLARANPQVVPVSAAAGEPLLRVGLLDEAPRFHLTLGGPYAVEGAGRTLPAQSAWLVELAPKGGWRMKAISPAAEADLGFSDVLRLRPLDPGSTFGLHEVDSGAGYFWADREDRYYRGVAELRPQRARGVTLVDELGLEAYLLSVVPSEIYAHWPAEALKAQAIAARTEAWASKGRFSAKGYDLCPTQLCAVYSGVGAEDKRSSAAVTATAGLVLQTEQGRLAPTFYMHNSGGHTQEPDEAWGLFNQGGASMAVVDAPDASPLRKLFPVGPAELLDFIDDLDGLPAWTRESSTWRWTLRLGADELETSVARRHPGVPPLKQVLPQQRTDGGYVQRVLFRGKADSIGSSDFIRSAIKGLKSNLFYVEPRLDADGRPRAFLFHGGGWGHGVGMSQVGAKAMAAAGLDAVQILRHYFPSERLQRRYGN